jgi:hypothetical protein
VNPVTPIAQHVIKDYTQHARLSPSGSKKWLSCSGSIALEQHVPTKTSAAADDGTCCHVVAAMCLTEHRRASHWIGQEIKVSGPNEEDRFLEFTEERAAKTQQYVGEVRYLGIGQEKWVEQRVKFSQYIDIPDQFGTMDFATYNPDEFLLDVRDAKFGYVPVEVEDNSQLKIYALGLLAKLEMSHDIRKVRLGIHQPQLRKGAITWDTTPEELYKWAEEVLKPAAHRTVEAERALTECSSSDQFEDWCARYLNQKPTESSCEFCKAQGICPTTQARMEEVLGKEFSVVAETPVDEIKSWVPLPGPKLDAAMAACDQMEDFIRAVRATMELHLLNGGTSELFGLELGRKGIRKWKDVETAEKMLREQFRVPMEHAYNMKLISPTQVEDRLAPKAPPKRKKKGAPEPVVEKPIIGPRQWAALQEEITRADPKPSVKLKSKIGIPYDPRALLPQDSDFTAVEEPEDYS